MNIGEQIKKLRQRSGISQETLARHIGVTAQAVSRWETGITAPDISLLPALAYYFQVSIDTLCEYHPEETAEALDDMFDRYFSTLSRDVGTAKEILDVALKRFPGNEQLQLLQLYHLRGEENFRQRIELCKRLSGSRQPTVRYEAMCALAATYHRSGEESALRELLAEIPECEETKLSLSARFLGGEESLDAAQRQKNSSLSILLDMLQIISECYRVQGQIEDAKVVLLVAQNVLEAFRMDVPFKFPKGKQPVQTYQQYSKEREALQNQLLLLEKR